MSKPPPPPPPDDLIVPLAASKLIRSHVATIYRLIHSGELRAYKRGARYLVSRADVLALLQPVQPAAKIDVYEEERISAATTERLRALGYKI